jgi:hypothetical protein
MPTKTTQKGATKAPAKRAAAKKPLASSGPPAQKADEATTPASTAWPEGLCETAAGEALYRQGFPHLRWLTDERVDDPAALATQALTAVEPLIDYGWPRSVAERAVRGYLAIGDEFGAASPKDAGVAAAVQRAGEVGEPGTIFRIALGRTRTSKDFAVEDFVFLVEAFAGANAVCDAILGALESDPEIMQRRGDALAIGRSLGFAMMRADGRDAFADRLAAVRTGAAKQKVGPTKFWSALLDTLGDGSAAFDGFGHALKYYVFVNDRARLVQKLRHAPGEFLPDMRFVYLGGPEVLELYEKRIDELPAGALARRFFTELSYVRHSIAEPLMRKLALRPDVGGLAKSWLERA